MSKLSMEVTMQRRSAVVDIGTYWHKKLGVDMGITPCHVLGLFQENDGEDYYPVFVCELNDGRVLTAVTSDVRFTDTEGGILK